jgi:hypothetical protein
MSPSLPHPFQPAMPATQQVGRQGIQPQQTVAVLVFVRYLSSPLVLYVEQPKALYQELQQIIQQARASQPKLIEKQASGPIGLVSFLDTEVVAVALQAELPAN